MTVTENWDYGHLSKQLWSVTVILVILLKSDFLFHVYFSVVICDFLVESS
jgi:hypothetical protein